MSDEKLETRGGRVMSDPVTAGFASGFGLGIATALLPQIVSAAWSWWRTRHWGRVARDAHHSAVVLRRMAQGRDE